MAKKSYCGECGQKLPEILKECVSCERRYREVTLDADGRCGRCRRGFLIGTGPVLADCPECGKARWVKASESKELCRACRPVKSKKKKESIKRPKLPTLYKLPGETFRVIYPCGHISETNDLSVLPARGLECQCGLRWKTMVEAEHASK